MSTQPPPHDHPGSYHVILLNPDPSAIQLTFDAQEAAGYKFKGMNDRLAVFYKDDRDEPHFS